MKLKLLGLIAYMALLGASQAGATTYNVDIVCAGGCSLTGTITTDGNTGVLSAPDIIDWNLAIEGGAIPANSSYDLLGPLSGNNSTVTLVGSVLTASAVGLFFNFGDPSKASLVFEDTTTPNNALAAFYSTFYYSLGGYANLDTYLGYVNYDPIVSSDNLQIAAVGTTPLPAALPLFASGLGAIGLFSWRRKRTNTAAIPA
jgi:hypothetical protein